MSKLWKLREWVPLDEAARVLSSLVGEGVTGAELLRLAIDNQLTLSVRFINGIHVRQWVEVDLRAVKWIEVPALDGDGFDRFPEAGSIEVREGYPPMQLIGPVMFLQPEVWDLPMFAAAANHVERQYQRLTGGPEHTLVPHCGVTIRSTSGTLFEVQVSRDDSDPRDAMGTKAPLREPEEFLAAVALPADAVLVVRPSALTALQSKLVEPESVKTLPSSPLSTKERETLLKLVIGMAVKGYCYNPSAARNSATREIAKDLEDLQISIDDDTVRKWLKEAAKAVLDGK